MIYFLCNIGLYRLAYRISPYNAASWQGDRIAKKMIESAEKIKHAMESVTLAFSKFAEEMQTQGGDDDESTNESERHHK